MNKSELYIACSDEIKTLATVRLYNILEGPIEPRELIKYSGIDVEKVKIAVNLLEDRLSIKSDDKNLIQNGILTYTVRNETQHFIDEILEKFGIYKNVSI